MADWDNEFLSKKQVYLRLREISEDYGRHSVDKQSAVLRCIDAVMEMPAADVAPVVYGKWVFDHMTSDTAFYAHCKTCGKKLHFRSIKEQDKFCKECGAMMDKEPEVSHG